MNADELRVFVTETIGDMMCMKGQMLYSGRETLRPGTFYFLAFNPVDDGTNPILHEWPFDRTNWSAYTDQCWTCGLERDCRQHEKERHQVQVIGMMEREFDTVPQETFATNLIFVESRHAEDIYSRGLCDLFWPIHKRFLSVVRPKYIVCLGYGDPASAFSVVRRKAVRKEKIQTEGHGVGLWKRFKGTFDLEGGTEDITVIGVWHPSYRIRYAGVGKFSRISGPA
jgi:hypothetical protein